MMSMSTFTTHTHKSTVTIAYLNFRLLFSHMPMLSHSSHDRRRMYANVQRAVCSSGPCCLYCSSNAVASRSCSAPALALVSLIATARKSWTPTNSAAQCRRDGVYSECRRETETENERSQRTQFVCKITHMHTLVMKGYACVCDIRIVLGIYIYI